uniref:Uncharacterized protein n=1 Tax=uncultured marine bacterium Ant4E12 TaxID=360424 RepID=Q2PYE6_9BACT|nr:hypothetical protein [uncultured marine bacterium Ant4E12]
MGVRMRCVAGWRLGLLANMSAAASLFEEANFECWVVS